MFDWDDEELANIIWDVAAESDDHIVPYPESGGVLHSKKEWNQEAADVKLTSPEQKTPNVKINSDGRKLESSSILNNEGRSASGFGMATLNAPSLLKDAKTDQSSLVTEVSKDSGPGQVIKDAQIFENANEGRELGDSVDYSWDNIGSFDDLDRIFSNDDPIFGHVNLDNADELWSSSKDMGNSPAPISMEAPNSSEALRNLSEQLEVKAEYGQRNESFSLNYEKFHGPASRGLQSLNATTGNVEYAGGQNKPMEKEQQVMAGKIAVAHPGVAAGNVMTNELTNKASWQKNVLKSRKTSIARHEGKMLLDFYGSWSPPGNFAGHFQNQLAASGAETSPLLGQQRQFQGRESLQYQFSNPFVTPSTYVNPAKTYSSMPMLSYVQPGQLGHQAPFSSHEFSPTKENLSKKSTEPPVKPLTMTPQEKIEKLRRRQQMQAMLAIQKQQQQFGRQVSFTNKPSGQKYPLESQNLASDGTDLEIEDLNVSLALEPYSPVEQNDSNTISLEADDFFVEDTILNRLLGIISKLDLKVRLCIRDSLFRLAQSAMQRQYASDTSSTNMSSRDELEVLAKEESNNKSRYARLPDVETETNPIDRTVAHLLFHRPLELTENPRETLDFPLSSKISCEDKAAGFVKHPMGCLKEDLKSKQRMSDQGFNISCSLAEAQPVDQLKNSPCMDASENACNHGPEDAGIQEVDTPH